MLKDKEKWGIRNLCNAYKENRTLLQTLNIIQTNTYKYTIFVETVPNAELVYTVEKRSKVTGEEIYTTKGFVKHNMPSTKIQYNIDKLPSSVKEYIAMHYRIFERVLLEGENVLNML